MAKQTVKTEEEPAYPKIVDRRFAQLRFAMEDHKVEAIVVTHLPNIRYLTNFSGTTATLFVLENEIHFFTDDRYEEQIKTELFKLPNLFIHITRDVWETLKTRKVLAKVTSLGFEADKMAYADAVEIRNVVRPVKFKPAPNVVEPFTQPKSLEEIEFIKKACAISEQTFKKVLEIIKPGMTERDIAAEISYISRKLGSENDAFPPLVISGSRGSLVHGQPTDRKLKKNEIVILDFGCKVNGFGSDIARTICLGTKPTKEQKAVHDVLRAALTAAIEGVRPGMNGKTLDSMARKLIEKAGYGDYFKHSLGHGIGLGAHEKPTITFRLEDQIVPEDSVLAIEPGIYIPGKFGMRIEDVVHVTRNGGVAVTTAPMEMVCLG